MKTTVRVELTQMNKKMQRLAAQFPKATAMAVNATRKRVITEQNRKIRETYNIKLKDLNDSITVPKIATADDPTTVIKVKSKPLGASHFGMKIGRQKGVPVRQRQPSMVQVKVGQIKPVQGYFGQRNAGRPGFNQNLWKRTGKQTGTGKDELDRFISINTAQFYKSSTGTDLITKQINRELSIELDRAIRALRLDIGKVGM